MTMKQIRQMNPGEQIRITGGYANLTVGEAVVTYVDCDTSRSLILIMRDDYEYIIPEAAVIGPVK